jgi:hypothetical protein
MQVTIDTDTVEVRELTVAEVRQWLNDAAADYGQDVVGVSLIEGVDFNLIHRMTDITPGKIETMKPSQLAEVVEACKAVNTHFFLMWERILAKSAPPTP